MARLLAALLAAAALPAAPVRADPLPGAPPRPPELAARLERARAGAPPEPRTRHRDPQGRPRFVNRLALESSPYLLQHAFNPVDWYPWGEPAFAAARRLGRPLLISIGYSTCHWCHVMEEESFEDPEIAEYLNRHYVAIKVDREERPDIDGVYMTAVQAMTGSGGWPMTIWATPDGEPFYAGTYFPPRDGAAGRPGFRTVLERIAAIHAERPAEVARVRDAVVRALRGVLEPAPSVGAPGARELRVAFAAYRARFDREHGGLDSRQKFPAVLPVSLLLRGHRRTGSADLLEMARITLDAMRRGGLYDHVGGGFHRYTVEPTWTVPHFEKMLYDNALLASAYTDAWQLTGDPAYRWVARDVLAYVTRDMTAPEGAFYTATDADSDGEEGRYFVWRPDEVRAAVGPELADLALEAFGLRGEPNFEGGRYVLRRDVEASELAARGGEPAQALEAQLAEIRARLRAARAKRVPPLRDEKQLVAWNGLMISAFARAGLAFRDPELWASGARAARALLENPRPGGRLARYLKDGRPHGVGLLDDHAFLAAGLLDLFEATAEPHWLEAAVALQAELDARFLDAEAGGYWISPSDGERLLARAKPVRDGARPSGNAVALSNLLRLYHLTTDESYRVTAEKTLRVFADRLRSSPTSHARMLEALDFMLDTPREILLVTPAGGDGAEPFLSALGRTYLPNRVLVVAAEPDIGARVERIPLLDRKRALGGRATAYVCENRVCELPTSDPAVFREQISRAPAAYEPDPPGTDETPGR